MKSIPLTQGQFAKVDDEDFEYVNQFKWYAWFNKDTQSYYARRNDRKGNIRNMHRFIMDTPVDLQCDHINHDTLDNTRKNLRNCTPSQNRMNVHIKRSNTSGYKGVSKDKKAWKAQLDKDGKSVFRKNFPTPEEAARAYDEAAKKHHGEFAFLNFPQTQE